MRWLLPASDRTPRASSRTVTSSFFLNDDLVSRGTRRRADGHRRPGVSVTAEPPAGEPDDRVAADRPADSDGVNVNGSVGEALDPHALTGDVPQQHGAVGDGSHPHALDSDDVDRSAGEAPPSPAVAVAGFGSPGGPAGRVAPLLPHPRGSPGPLGPPAGARPRGRAG